MGVNKVYILQQWTELPPSGGKAATNRFTLMLIVIRYVQIAAYHYPFILQESCVLVNSYTAVSIGLMHMVVIWLHFVRNYNRAFIEGASTVLLYTSNFILMDMDFFLVRYHTNCGVLHQMPYVHRYYSLEALEAAHRGHTREPYVAALLCARDHKVADSS